MGRESADMLMGLLPPIGWADVATRHDLSGLEQRMDARLDTLDQGLRDLRQDLSDVRHDVNGMAWKLFAIVVMLVPALVVPLVTLR